MSSSRAVVVAAGQRALALGLLLGGLVLLTLMFGSEAAQAAENGPGPGLVSAAKKTPAHVAPATHRVTHVVRPATRTASHTVSRTVRPAVQKAPPVVHAPVPVLANVVREVKTAVAPVKRLGDGVAAPKVDDATVRPVPDTQRVAGGRAAAHLDPRAAGPVRSAASALTVLRGAAHLTAASIGSAMEAFGSGMPGPGPLPLAPGSPEGSASLGWTNALSGLLVGALVLLLFLGLSRTRTRLSALPAGPAFPPGSSPD